MALKSKFFRIGTEGDTTDGRVIERGWIQQMADTYDRAKYAARVWMEHIRGFTPEGPFGAYGDVLALQAREVENGKLALFAQIEPLPALVALNRARQKLYSSMEIATNFAKSGKAYLIGLAVTDTPASLGNDILAFAAQNPQANPLAGRKQDADNLFSAAHAVELTFEDSVDEKTEDPAALAKLTTLAESLRNFFSKPREDAAPAPVDTQPQTSAATQQPYTAQALDVLLNGVTTLVGSVATLTRQVSESHTREQTLLEQMQQLRGQFDGMQQQLTRQDANPDTVRALATGGANQIQTDC